MTRAQKRKFMRDLTRNVLLGALANVPKMPEAWDGHELRAYMADKFRDACGTVGRPGPDGRPYARRTREYRNTVIVENL